MAKIIAIANQKGGVGKTTTCVNLTAALTLLGKKVLIADCDPQGNATSGLGVSKNSVPGAYELLISGEEVLSCIRHTDYGDIIPAGRNLAAASIELEEIPTRENTLRNSIRKLFYDYDYIFIDCPPSLGLLTLNALNAADTLLVPIQCEFYALEGLSQLMNTVKLVRKNLNPNLDVEGVVLTMYDARTNLSVQVVEEVKKFFKNKVYDTIIPRSVRLGEAPSFGLPITHYARNSAGANAYISLAEEILRKGDC